MNYSENRPYELATNSAETATYHVTIETNSTEINAFVHIYMSDGLAELAMDLQS